MTDYPESGVKLIVDTAAAQAAVSDLQSMLDDIQSTTYTATVAAEVDDSGLSDLPADGETIDVGVNVTQEGDELPPDGETIDSTINTTVEGADDNSNNILQTLVGIKRNQQFRMALDIAGTAVDFFKNIAQFSIQPMVDLDNELAHIKATTGEVIPGADKLINKIFYSDLGDSITQVGDLVAQAEQLRTPIDESVTAALELTKVFTDQSPEQTLNTLNQLVQNQLEPNFKQAGNELVVAFQNGANRGGDLLNTLNLNATAIHDLGLNGAQSLEFIISGLDAGFTSADEVLKTLEKIKINVQGAAGNNKSKVSETLNTLGIANPAETGKAWSAEFFENVIKGIQTAHVSDSEKMVMFQNLVGGKLSAKEFSSFMALSPADADALFTNTKSAAADAATSIDDSLGGAIKDFERAAQGAAVDFLSSKQIDLPSKISALKQGLQDGLKTLQEGGSIQDAITVSLKPIGLDTAFQSFESTLGNFVIAILQAVAAFQDISDSKLAAGTRNVIASQGQTQLGFDLKIANPDEVAGDIETAVSRGVTPEKIASTVADTVNSLIESGNRKAAQVLLDSVKEAQNDLNKNAQLTSSGSLLNVQPNLTPDAIANLQKQIDQANANAGTSFLVQQQNAVIDATNTVKPGVDGLQQSANKTYGPVQTVADKTAVFGTNAGKAIVSVQNVAGATVDVGVSAANAYNPLVNMSTAIDQITGSANALKSAANNVASVQGQLNGNTTADPGKHATGGAFVGTSIVGEAGREIVSSNMGLAVLNNMTTEKILAALAGYVPGAGGGSSSHVSNTINNVNVIPNIATGDALGYRQASVLRGMG